MTLEEGRVSGGKTVLKEELSAKDVENLETRRENETCYFKHE